MVSGLVCATDGSITGLLGSHVPGFPISQVLGQRDAIGGVRNNLRANTPECRARPGCRMYEKTRAKTHIDRTTRRPCQSVREFGFGIPTLYSRIVPGNNKNYLLRVFNTLRCLVLPVSTRVSNSQYPVTAKVRSWASKSNPNATIRLSLVPLKTNAQKPGRWPYLPLFAPSGFR